MSATDILTRTAAQAAAPGWRYLVGQLHLSTQWADFAEALDFVNQVGRLAEEQGHHPDIDLRYAHVHLSLSSHDVGGVTDRDIRLANDITQLVEAGGARVQPERLTAVEIAIDTMDAAQIRPFWRAILGYQDSRSEDDTITDPNGIGPSVWFQQLDQPRPVRNRIHLDVIVAHDEAEQRLAAALAAGGRLVSDAAAPRFWVLADADGNEACICTWQNRD